MRDLEMGVGGNCHSHLAQPSAPSMARSACLVTGVRHPSLAAKGAVRTLRVNAFSSDHALRGHWRTQLELLLCRTFLPDLHDTGDAREEAEVEGDADHAAALSNGALEQPIQGDGNWMVDGRSGVVVVYDDAAAAENAAVHPCDEAPAQQHHKHHSCRPYRVQDCDHTFGVDEVADVDSCRVKASVLSYMMPDLMAETRSWSMVTRRPTASRSREWDV